MTTGSCVLPHRRDPDRKRGTRPPALVCLGCETWLRTTLVGADRTDATGRIREHIRGLPELHEDLEDALAPDGGQRPGGGGGLASATRLPFRPLVSVHRDAIAQTLQTWTHRVALVRGEHDVTNPVPRRTAAWLADRLDWLTTVPAVVEFAADLSALRGRALSLLDPVHRAYVLVAWCAETGADCPGRLIAAVATNDRTLPGTIVCDVCDTTWTPVSIERPPRSWGRLGELVDQARANTTGGAA